MNSAFLILVCILGLIGLGLFLAQPTSTIIGTLNQTIMINTSFDNSTLIALLGQKLNLTGGTLSGILSAGKNINSTGYLTNSTVGFTGNCSVQGIGVIMVSGGIVISCPP